MNRTGRPAHALQAAFALVALLPALSLQRGSRGQDPKPDMSEIVADPAALFVTNCASCHGATGDGQGTTVLDRPARSFMDGGFSFGNTPEALFRTISIGIPGTPMPGFASSLSEGQLRALADHVITLGPETLEVDTDAARLVVGERPFVVRGMLPAVSEGGEAIPRGLLIGTLDGLSFEYRADDVRLLAVRQGEFVERTDWIGRGGSALKPLGQIVHLVEDGRPEAPFALAPLLDGIERPLQCDLAGTWVSGGNVGLRYRLSNAASRRQGFVQETVQATHNPLGSGFLRQLRLNGLRETLRFRAARTTGDDALESFEQYGHVDATTKKWIAITTPSGVAHCISFATGLKDATWVIEGRSVWVELPPSKTRQATLTLTHLMIPDWNEATREVLSMESWR